MATRAGEKRSGLVGALVRPSIKAELLEIAERDDRSLSFVAGALIERGLEAFRRDGALRSRHVEDNDQNGKRSKGKLGVITAKTETPVRRRTKP